ncbi:hypothetical protein N7468_004830 [Penicillium chermesinum]|uniref:Uncharacterized protein n=1 Tax=Penicillium chermesinum TaxID=63820 RepID=A0A9W9P928_9EURO|nr:uncharacterized protein N7468_004830 [Penicillium chermesinum]KAJ5240211.1 hypothetical protein N7468_004830 [Penicillium chermesinum]
MPSSVSNEGVQGMNGDLNGYRYRCAQGPVWDLSYFSHEGGPRSGQDHDPKAENPGVAARWRKWYRSEEGRPGPESKAPDLVNVAEPIPNPAFITPSPRQAKPENW